LGILAYIFFAMLVLFNIWTEISRKGTACINPLPFLRILCIQHALLANSKMMIETLRYTTVFGTGIYAQMFPRSPLCSVEK
jgi:hypothetical protein